MHMLLPAFLRSEKTFKKLKKVLYKPGSKWYYITCRYDVATKPNKYEMRYWRNWQTRTVEGRMGNTVMVQVHYTAPLSKDP